MLNHKNLQKNLGRTGGAANSKIVGTSSWTIPIESPYATFLLVNDTLSYRFQVTVDISGHIFAFDRGYLSLTHSFVVNH